MAECSDDSHFLNTLLQGHPAQPDRYRQMHFRVANPDSYIEEVKTAWAACGIGVTVMNCGYSTHNQYYDAATGNSISQSEARQLAMQRIGRQLSKSDWDW